MAGFALLGVAHDLPMLLLSSTFIPLGMGLTTASVTTLISLRASADRQGATFGIGQSVAGIAQITGPSFGSTVFSRGTCIRHFWPAIHSRGICVAAPAIVVSILFAASKAKQVERSGLL